MFRVTKLQYITAMGSIRLLKKYNTGEDICRTRPVRAETASKLQHNRGKFVREQIHAGPSAAPRTSLRHESENPRETGARAGRAT